MADHWVGLAHLQTVMPALVLLCESAMVPACRKNETLIMLFPVSFVEKLSFRGLGEKKHPRFVQ